MTGSGPASPTFGIAEKLHDVFALDGDAAAVEFEGREFPLRIFVAAGEVLAGLTGAGRTTVGVVLRNRPAHAAAVVGTLATGGTLITLSGFHGDAALVDDVRTLRPSVVAADAADWARPGLREAVDEIGAVRIELGPDGSLRPVSAPGDWTEPGLPGVAVLMLTSGTTGRPKRVPLGYDRLAASLEASGTDAGPSHPAALHPGPGIVWTSFVHIGGLYFLVLHALEGRPIALLERFEIGPWTELVRRLRPQTISLVPTAMRMVLDAEVPPDVFEGVLAARAGTAPMPPELAEEFTARYGVPVLVNYGATEFAGALTRMTLGDLRRHGAAKRGTVGRPVDGVELRTVDRDTLEPLGPGEIGLLQAKGVVTGGPGWTTTTDLASIDTDGYAYIHGRVDDAINRGGFKVVPVVVEDVLRTHPAVEDAAVVGRPDPRLGAVPVAAVQLRPGAQASVQELLDHVRAHLARYQVPVELAIVDELPRTPSMKVSRPALLALFERD